MSFIDENRASRPAPEPFSAARGRTDADALVLFGATGDLARKKLFFALYHMAAAGNLGIPPPC